MTMNNDPWQYNYRGAKPRKALRGMCGVDGCDNQTLRSYPVCDGHAWALWKELEEQNNWHAEQKKREARENHEKCEIDTEYEHVIEYSLDGKGKAAPAPRNQIAGHIYYLQVGEHIKIGYTSSLYDRMKSYPPNSTMLAIHPGTYQTEKQIHNKFNDLIAHGREWFTDHERIRTHIRHVHDQYPKHNKNLVT